MLLNNTGYILQVYHDNTERIRGKGIKMGRTGQLNRRLFADHRKSYV
jgi:hypothetical protein